MRPLNIFIGFDEAEPIAFHACSESIIRNSSLPVSITPLYKKQLAFKEPEHKEGYPPSNGFIFSRFLVPYMMGFQGIAMFVDGDNIITGDVADLFLEFDHSKAVSVVKHDYTPKNSVKYLGAVNQAYPRKNWSSMIMWNCGHYHNAKLLPSFIAKQTGEYLHRFQWLDDDRIGSLDKGWNYLVSEENQCEPSEIKNFHYTVGTPCWSEWRSLGYADVWDEYHALANDYKGKP